MDCFMHQRRLHRTERGLSMVELLVGTALGLFIVASTVTLLLTHLREQRSLLTEARLMQDLRATADLMVRDLRRAAYWGDAVVGLGSADAATRPNPYGALAPSAAASNVMRFSYSRDATENHAVDGNETFGWRLREGALELDLGSGWQRLTDPSLLTVTGFSVTPSVEQIDLSDLCTRPCDVQAAAAAMCPPRQQIRRMTLRIDGRATGSTGAVRSIETQVKLRNDVVVGTCSGWPLL
jgi:prepilin peptidase dependent protein B